MIIETYIATTISSNYLSSFNLKNTRKRILTLTREMKLIYSTSLVTIICIHILFTHTLFIHLSFISVQASGHGKHENDENSQLFQISQENKKILNEQVKAHLLKVLGLKEVPKKPQNKAYVPHAMLEEYRKIRESVRDVIPDDRDFYGKMDIDSIDHNSHDDFWSEIYNKYGGYDIEVDMGKDDEEARRLHYKGDATPIACLVPQGEPEDVPPRLEHALPPHASSIKNQKHFISVHLKFNLSQEIFTDPINSEDIKRADLFLSREKILECNENDCDRKLVPLSTSGDKESSKSKDYIKSINGGSSIGSSSRISDSDSNLTNKKYRNKPRYQRVYVLQIYGYDEHKEPIARIHDTKRIDTSQSTPLSFEISGIIRRWLIDPSKNYGIIVRVTNDDDEFERIMLQRQQEQQAQIQKRSVSMKTSNTDYTNASQNNVSNPKIEVEVEEHVRLKREFRSYGESKESWLKKQPSIIIYSSKPDNTRHHVKRDQLALGSARATSSSSGNNQNQKIRGKGKPGSRAAEKCGVRSLAINFDDVGWSNWIIAPTAYFANYCAGDCSFPVNSQQNSTNHAIIQSIFHSVGRVVPRSCCAPTKLGQMAILYQLDGSVQMKHYDDMIVEACGCL